MKQFRDWLKRPLFEYVFAIVASFLLPYWANSTLWPIGTVFCLPLIGLFIFSRERKRARMILEERSRNQLCLTCGYDLRATPERCPECGTIPTKTKTS
jgi:hypothetical protein